MSIREYRLTSMEEPSDEILHQLMEQVAESARQSSANAKRVLQEKMQEFFLRFSYSFSLRDFIVGSFLKRYSPEESIAMFHSE